MKRLLMICLLLTAILPAFAQKEAYNWYFGGNAGLSFATTPPTPLMNGALNTSEGCATISDKNGALLFYTDGTRVWNKNHLVMTNGTGLKGNPSCTQSAVISPWPGDPAKYLIFTVDATENSLKEGFNYSIVDMSKQGGLGEITTKNIKLVDSACEKITVVQHRNRRDLWVVVQKWGGNAHYAFQISTTGINTIPVISYIGQQLTGIDFARSLGYLKCSPDGQWLAGAQWSDEFTELFRFNNQTGAITNLVTIPSSNGSQPYGVEFSPDGKKLYIVSCCEAQNTFFQFDLTAPNIVASEQEIGRLNVPMYAGCLQVAPDGKIYFPRQIVDSLGVIENPNVLGVGCGFKPSAISLNGRISRLGLPNFIQSFFQKGSFDVSKFCYNDSTLFKITVPLTDVDSVLWDFGDPASGAQNISRDTMPYHIYSAAGDFKPRLIIYFNNTVAGNMPDTVIKDVDIVYGKKPSLGIDRELCDSVPVILSVQAGFSKIRWSTGPLDTLSVLTVTQSGTYIVTTRDAGHCLNADTVNVSYNKILLTLPKDTVVCMGDSVMVDAGNAGFRFAWSNGDTTQQLAIKQGGLYTVIISKGGCSERDSINVTQLTKGIFSLGNDTALCSGQLLPLKISLAGTAYSWSTDATTDSISAASQGTYIGHVQTMCGLVSDTLVLTVHRTPVISADTIKRWCSSPIILDASNPGSTYLWSPGGDTTRTIQVNQLGIFMVTISDNGNCAVSNTFIVRSGCPVKIWIPNAFTPNQDKLNDIFAVESIGEIIEFKFQIYNRWGELIYTTNNISGGWDGTYSGKDCPDGIYYWQLDCKDFNRSSIRRNGTVTLLR